MNLIARWLRRNRDDAGAAMITSVLISAVLAGLGIAIADVSISNLQNAGRDRVGSSALSTSESGVAQAIAQIRLNGVGWLDCAPNCPASATSPHWGSKDFPMRVTLSGGRTFQVYISRIQPFDPPTYKSGVYKIFSSGTSGQGPGLRNVEVTVTVKPMEYPIGVFGQQFEDAGAGKVYNTHLFSATCIANRDHMTFSTAPDPRTGQTSDVDPYYGWTPAAHAVTQVIEGNQLSNCKPSGSIHAANPCNTKYPADRDGMGGNVSGNPTCASKVWGGESSKFTQADLDALNIDTGRGLTTAQYDALRAKAQEQGNYYTNANLGAFKPPCPADPCPAGQTAQPNAVVYFRVDSKTTIDQIRQIAGYERNQWCGIRSLVFVVEGGNMTVNAGTNVTGAIFVPDGNLKFNGDAIISGTVWAKTVGKFNGTSEFYLDKCFLKNMPGGLMNVEPTRFHEADR